MDYTGSPETPIKRASSTKRRSPSADKKRQLIIESAERICATRGFHDTTIADISNDCGVHEASIFQYFKTKESLRSDKDTGSKKIITKVISHKYDKRTVLSDGNTKPLKLNENEKI